MLISYDGFTLMEGWDEVEVMCILGKNHLLVSLSFEP